MKRRYVVTGLGLIAVLALVTTAIAGGGIGPGAHAAKKARRGPAGPAGPQGPPGAQGAPGAPGAPGSLSGTVVRFANSVAVSTGQSTGRITKACNAGEKLVGGGAYWTAGTTGATTGLILESFPTNSSGTPVTQGGTPTEWTASGINSSGPASNTLQVTAVCALP